MKLVGKKLYRVGPLKCFKGGGGGPRGPGAAERARKAQAEADRKKLEGEWKGESMRDLYDPEQKSLYQRRKQLAEDVGSGAAARRGAEAGLKAQMAAAGAGRGSAAQRMRGLSRAGEAGTRAAAAQGAGAAAQQFGMLGQAGQGRFGMQKSDKAGRLGFFQKKLGLDVARETGKEQAQATKEANQDSKASGGEIYKKYRKNEEFPRKNGKIEGPGTETSDDIKAKLSDGEFVINAKTVRGLGEAMGADGKEDSRKKGAGFLYDLQTKYGDKKPVSKFLGGMQIAELGAHAAKKGLLGKKLKGAGSIASGALDVKKGLDSKEADRVKEETSGFGKQLKGVDLAKLNKGGDVKPLKPKSVVREGEFKPDPNTDPRDEKMKRSWSKFKKGGKFSDKERKSHLKMALDMVKAKKGDAKDLYKKMSGRGDYPKELVIGKAKGGHINLGKGIKAKRKFREAIGWEADKIFDKKAEKDYKEGDTGYKNYKGEKSVTPVEMGLGGFLSKVGRVGLKAGQGFLMGGPAGAAVGAGKGVMDEASSDKQKSQAKKQSMAEAKIASAQKEQEAAQGLGEVSLKKGGAVKYKGHPHKAYLDELDKFMAHAFPKGKKVETDPAKKAEKAIKSKKGSIDPIEPYKFSEGGSVKMKEGGDWRKEIADKITKKYGHVLNSKALRQRINKAIVSEKDFREGAAKTSKMWNPQRIAAMEDHHLGKKAKVERKQAESKKKLKGFEKLGESGGRKRDPVGEKRKKFLEKEKTDATLKHMQDRRNKTELLRNMNRIKDTGDASHLEDIGRKKIQKRKLEAEMADAHLGDAKGLEGNRTAMDAMSKHYQKLDNKKAAEEHDKRQANKRKAFLKSKKEEALTMKRELQKRRSGKDLAPEVKKDKSWWGDMPDKDKAGLVFGAGKGLLDARQAHLKEKQARRQRIAAGRRLGAATQAKAAQQLIGSSVSLRKGGHVSFKDVLKAKKKMGY